jgi:hypothetical protein
VEYIKLDPDIDSDPDIEAAGWCAARVYELLLKVSAKKDLRGRIPPAYRSPEWLARRWNLTARDLPGVSPEDFIANGLARMVGLLADLDGDALVLRGWEKHYRPSKTGAERMRTMRSRHRDERDERDEAPSPIVTRDARDESDATPLHNTPLHNTPPTPQKTTEQAPPAFFPAKPEKPAKDDDVWDGMDFWAWAQAKRGEEGLATERRPNERAVSAWWSAVRMSGFSTKAMRLAFVAFGNDPYWSHGDRAPPVPFGAFLKRWQDFARQEAA